jgi:hypothetical protein
MDRETEQRLNEEAAQMDEQLPAEAVETNPPAAKRKPRKRAQATKRAGAKKPEHHTSVARRSTRKRGAASARKTTKAQPKRRATRGTKEVASTGAVARTARAGKKPTAKAKTSRVPARRTPKRR